LVGVAVVLACPLLPVATGLEPKLNPVLEKVTVTPGTAMLLASSTWTVRGFVKGVSAAALCPLPETTEMLAGAPATASVMLPLEDVKLPSPE
jgi:hypothetical protein